LWREVIYDSEFDEKIGERLAVNLAEDNSYVENLQTDVRLLIEADYISSATF